MRMIVKIGEKNIANIEATQMLQDQQYLYAFKGEDLVGMFSIGCFDAAFLFETEKNDR